MFVLSAALLLADGGSVLLRQQSGPFLITVFGAPQVGTTDISVLLQTANDQNPLLNARVELRIGDSPVRATHEHATNKLLYAAPVNLTRPGKQRLQINVEWNGNAAQFEGDLDVARAAPSWIAYWPYFALVPVAILFFVLNQWLKNKRRVSRRQAPP